MKNLFKIAIVGRPNVGKSALFNRISKKRIAIVDEEEGVTRDRLYNQTELFGKPFEVIDTGGIDARSELPFNEEVKRQAEIAIIEADALIMVVDSIIGVTTLDEEVVRILRNADKPIYLAINKIDDLSQANRIHQFHSLSLDKMIGISAAHGYHVAELFEMALETAPDEVPEIDDDRIKVAIIGRPNVGKSTLINHLLDEDRCVVSPVPGTTRDHIDVTVTYEDQEFTFIDTAGIRRKKSEHFVVDKFAAIRTERAISRADVCVLMLDAATGMTAQEKRIARHIEQEGKGCILLFNKWDLVKGFRMEHCLQGIRMELPFLSYVPAFFASASTGKNVLTLFEHIRTAHAALNARISTGVLNQFIEKTMQKYHPPMIKGKRLRVYYMAQVEVCPPRFVMFINNPKLMLDSYHKYIINTFRKSHPFSGAPLRFYIKGKKKMVKQEA